MKKMGIFALALAATTSAYANQDYIKSFSWTSYNRQVYSDLKNKDEIGWAGFDGANKGLNRWENTVNGVIALQDEGDLELSVYARLRRDEYKNKATNNRENSWETVTELSKNYTIGNWDARWTLGWQYNQTSSTENGTSRLKSTGYANQFYVGPSFSVDYFGQTFDLVLQGVYFNSNGDEDLDYIVENTEGWGVNAHIYNNGDILSGKYGTLSYYVSLENSLKDGFKSGNKSSVYIDYKSGFVYTTPSYKGFSGSLHIENEFSRNTGVTGKTNEAGAWLAVNHTSTLDTSIGKVSLTPFVSYKPWSRITKWEDKTRRTKETNEWRAGFTLGYTAK